MHGLTNIKLFDTECQRTQKFYMRFKVTIRRNTCNRADYFSGNSLSAVGR